MLYQETMTAKVLIRFFKRLIEVLMITTMEPFRDRLNGATSGSA